MEAKGQELDVDFNIMHAQIRNNVLHRVRQRLPQHHDTMILLQGGSQQTRYDTDADELFRQESFFHYLFGVKEAEFWGAIDVSTGRSILFPPRLHEAWAVWDGVIHQPAYFAQHYGVDEAFFSDELIRVLETLEVRKVLLLKGTNTDSGKTFDEIDTSIFSESIELDFDILMPVLTECRVRKTDMEVRVLRYVNDITSEAHKYVMRCIRPGMYEYQLESLFLHYCSYHMHARYVPYSCICCTGPDGAILHFGGAASPLEHIVSDGDMCLLDMGTEHHCYVSDVTCSFPANGNFTEEQRVIYQAVYQAQRAVESNAKPGVEWVDMHLLAERVLLKHLVDAGFLNGDVEELLNNRICAYFQPHGLGHMMGLDVHDVGGFSEGRARIQKPGLKSLRANRILEEGMVLSNEPGLYFISTLLRPALEDPSVSKYFNRALVEQYLDAGFGGVRLEDDIVITADGCETLTKVPRSIEEVQNFMALPKIVPFAEPE